MIDVLLLDNRDSFTFNLAHVCAELGARVDVVDSDLVTADHIIAAREDGVGPALVVVGPGPRSPQDMPRLVELLQQLDGRVPVFGVCLGLQAMVRARGGVVGRAQRPMHGKRDPITHSGIGCLAGLPSPLWVMRYHSLVALDLPSSLSVTAVDDAGQAMALRDVKARFEAVQFHPESIGTAGGVELMANVLRGAGIAVRDVRRDKTVPPPSSTGLRFVTT
ncbi:MAG TPA: aminodeoxychorismate/anthranilate synthase component II [Myxococcota bacterium]